MLILADYLNLFPGLFMMCGWFFGGTTQLSYNLVKTKPHYNRLLEKQITRKLHNNVVHSPVA